MNSKLAFLRIEKLFIVFAQTQHHGSHSDHLCIKLDATTEKLQNRTTD